MPTPVRYTETFDRLTLVAKFPEGEVRLTNSRSGLSLSTKLEPTIVPRKNALRALLSRLDETPCKTQGEKMQTIKAQWEALSSVTELLPCDRYERIA